MVSGHAHLAPVAGLSGAIGRALLPRARALPMLGVVLDVQVVAGVLRRHVTAGARLAVVVVDGALHRHLRRLGGVDAGVVVCWQEPSVATSVSFTAGGGWRISRLLLYVLNA